MNKVAQRLLVFFIGIPFILALVFFNFYNNLLLNIAACTTSAIGAYEFYNMLSKKNKLFRKPVVITLATLLPILNYNFIIFGVSLEIIPWFFVFTIFLLMGIESFSQKDFTFSLEKIAYSTLIIFYCGFLPTFITKMTVFEDAKYFLSLYFLFVFMCDSGAWFFGVCFGKNNRGIFKASPNKSIAGFIGGIASCIGTGCIFKAVFPDVITCSYVQMIIWGLFVSLASIIGDLIESVFKRSADVKDSGNLIPGRGGILDCMDSLLLAAPVFYIGVHFLF